MKKLILLFIAALTMGFSLWAQDCKQIKRDQLPQAARHYVMDNWNNVSITYIYQKIDNYTVNYEVRLVDGTLIYFNRDGGWRKVDSQKPLPKSAIPANIYKYIKEHHSGCQVTHMVKGGDGYSVTLDNEKSLIFDLEGNRTN